MRKIFYQKFSRALITYVVHIKCICKMYMNKTYHRTYSTFTFKWYLSNLTVILNE